MFRLYTGFLLTVVSDFVPLLFNQLFPPFYAPVLKPNFDLSFSQSKLLRKIKPLPSNHVLLTRELSFQSLKLLHGKDGAHAFWFVVRPVCFINGGQESSCVHVREAS